MGSHLRSKKWNQYERRSSKAQLYFLDSQHCFQIRFWLDKNKIEPKIKNPSCSSTYFRPNLYYPCQYWIKIIGDISLYSFVWNRSFSHISPFALDSFWIWDSLQWFSDIDDDDFSDDFFGDLRQYNGSADEEQCGHVFLLRCGIQLTADSVRFLHFEIYVGGLGTL